MIHHGCKQFHAYVPQADADTVFGPWSISPIMNTAPGGYTGTIAEKETPTSWCQEHTVALSDRH